VARQIELISFVSPCCTHLNQVEGSITTDSEKTVRNFQDRILKMIRNFSKSLVLNQMDHAENICLEHKEHASLPKSRPLKNAHFSLAYKAFRFFDDGRCAGARPAGACKKNG
jgi:hypothetical protein